LGDADRLLLSLALELESESDTNDGNVPDDTSFRGRSGSEDNNGNESAEILLFLHIVKHNDMEMLE
jgi:hypothetical protein